jgi:uncharacterized protein YbjT (DUF2867 family)
MTTPRRTIVVTAASGRQGRATAIALLEHGWPVRALVRDPDSAPAVGLATAGAEVSVCDLDDADAIKLALDGAHGLFLYQPGFVSPELTPGLGPDSELSRGRTVISAALTAGISHLVYSSGLGANLGLSPLYAPKQALEQQLAASGVPFTIMRPVGFMENYAGPGRGLQPDGTISTPAPPHIVEQLIAVRDIGAFAAIAFANPGLYAGQALEVAGDELTVPQIAAAMTTALDRPIRYSQIPIEEIRRGDPDRAASLEHLYNLEPACANIPHLRDQHAELLTFEQWLAACGAEQVAAYLEPATADTTTPSPPKT